MSETKKGPSETVQMIRGCPFPKALYLSKKNFEDVMDYVPKDGDVIIASFPKTGTTWLQYIVLQIVSKGEWFPDFNDTTTKVVPFVEMSGIGAVEAIDYKPRMYKHHIPYNMVQKNDKAKYIYIYRNPEDTVVSYFHFMKNLQVEGSEQTGFDQFFDNFVAGNVGYGNYFEHVLSYYERRGSESLLMVSYEDLYVHRRDGILRIAKFLGEEYHQCLMENDDVLNKVVEHTAFDYMKKNLHLNHPHKKDKEGGKIKVNFFRKGIVGDGKNVLTPDQRARVEEAARKILTGTTVIDEWYASKSGENYKSNDCVQFIRGCPFPLVPWFSKKNIEEAMDYLPKDNDIIIASYPKTGTTWLQYIVLQIVSSGESFPSFDDVLYKVMPFLEMSGIAAVEALESRPRIYKHHMAYNMVQKNDKAKYVYIYRNPEDTVVSFYHFMKSFQLESYNKVDFNAFVDDFITGNLGYGNYFQHLSSYYRHRNDKNLLMISYEKMHANRKDWILKIAEFLGKEYHQSLLDKEDVLTDVIEHTTFDYMKKNLYLTHPGKKEEKDSIVEFFRKGIIGDGKTTLSNDQCIRIKEEALKFLDGTPIIQEWYSE